MCNREKYHRIEGKKKNITQQNKYEILGLSRNNELHRSRMGE